MTTAADLPASARPYAIVGAAVAATAVAVLTATVEARADGPLLWLFPVSAAAWLAPGFLLALRSDPSAPPAALCIRAAGYASAVHIASALFASFIGPTPTPGPLVHALSAATVLILGADLLRRPPRADARSRPDDLRFAAAMALVLLGAVVMVGKRLFSDLSSDGVEAYEMARSLREHAFPRTPGENGVLGLGVGMLTQIFPAYWFDTLFPASDVGPRLPLLLFLPLVFAGVTALAEHGRSRRAEWPQLIAAALTTLTFGAVLGMNASFDPYHCDSSSPGAIDVQTGALLLGLFEAAAALSTPRLLLFALLGHGARPTTFLVLLILAATVRLYAARGERRAALLRTGAALAACVVFTILYEQVYAPIATGEGAALGSGSLTGRLRYLVFTDWNRFAYLLVPTGLLGAAALLLPHKMDGLGRTLAFTSVALFGFFYVPAAYAPHHFTPVMLLPVAVLHRLLLSADPRSARRVATAAVVFAGAGLFATLPTDAETPARPYSPVGRRLLWQAPELGRDLPRALAAAELVSTLLIPCHDGTDPATRLMGSPLSLVRYATRDPNAEGKVDFIVRSYDAPAPTGYVRLDADLGFALYGRTPDLLEATRRLTRPTAWQSPFFRIDRRRLFRNTVIADGLYDLDLRRILSR